MAYASRSGRARTDSKNPQAFAVCDRCGFWYNHVNLSWQMGWRGTQVQNLRILVCNRCLDGLQEQLRTIRIPADPLPVINARPENFLADELPNGPTNVPYGAPLGLQPGGVMPNAGSPNVVYDQKLIPISVVGTGNGVQVTLNAPVANWAPLGEIPQVSILGLTNVQACGFYSVTFLSSLTGFAYTLAPGVQVGTGSLMGPRTRIRTCHVGLPRGNPAIVPISAPNE